VGVLYLSEEETGLEVRMRAKHSLFGMLLAACWFLTGCTVSIVTTVNPNGSGELEIIYKLSEEDKKTFTQSGTMDAGKLCEGMATMSESVPGQGTIKQEKHGSETWCVMGQAFGSLEEMRSKLDTQGFTVNTASIDNGQFIFDATMNSGDSSSELNMGMPIGLTFELTLPGKVIRHNADKVKSYTLIWEMGLGQVKQIHAESGLEGRSTNWMDIIQKPLVILPCIGFVILLLVILIISELTRGSRRRKPPVGQ
jgi:hypothetical protein